MNKKLFLFTGILIASLMALLMMLIHWGQKSIELREALFVDQLQVEVDELIADVELNYYCFDLKTDVAMPKMESFYLDEFPGASKDTLPLRYKTREGKEIVFSKMPIMGPGQMHVLLRFEFDDIPEFRDDSSLSDFELWVRDSYAGYIESPNGIRLVDTTRFDSLLLACATRLYPEADMSFSISMKEGGETIYQNNPTDLLLFNPDIQASMFEEDEAIPDLMLSLAIPNKSAMFSGEAWNIYISAIVLALISMLLIFYLIRMYMQQRKLMQTQRDFIHGITHEFNTPITSIKMIAQKMSKSTDDKIAKAGEILDEEGKKLQMGIDLVLTTALIEKDELFLEKNEVDLRNLIENLQKRNEVMLSESGIHLDISLSADPLLTEGDSYHLENVMQNLINNVRKHSQASQLKIESVRENGHVKIDFIDDGRGISKNAKNKIFKKFERESNGHTKNGYGLGLYYAKMILKMHGGDIELDQHLNRGTHFSIMLPA